MSSSPELEEAACSLCGSSRRRMLFDRPYALKAPDSGACAATTDEFQDYGRIVRCLDCAMTYTSPRPRARELAEAYGRGVDEDYLAESSSRSINAHLSLNTIRRHAKGGRLLDIGAAVGYFLNAARADFEVFGVEPSEWACRVARERFRLDVSRGTLDSVSLEAESFEAAAMIDVIEHLADPKAAVRRAAGLLKRGGILYVVTPDIGSLSARLLRGYWWGLRPAHVQYFDRKTLRRLLEEAGFEIVLEKSFGRIFSYGYWASRLRNYPGIVYGPVSRVVRALGLEDKLFYIDTRDSVEVCARRT